DFTAVIKFWLSAKALSAILTNGRSCRHLIQQPKRSRQMNILNALERVRDRLQENGARPETMQLVGTIEKTASTPGADRAQVRSVTDLVRRLMRTPVANQNVGV